VYVSVRLQGICLAPAAVEREHVQLTPPLLQRVLPRQRSQLRQHLSMPGQLDVEGDAVLQRQQPQRPQPIALGANVLTPGPAQRFASP